MKAKLTLEQFDLINRLGKKYTPAVCPDDIKRFDVGMCFDACIWNAIYHPQYRYVEGVVLLHGDLQWKLHAWLTDGKHAFDPTWKADVNGEEKPIPATYIGIEMGTKEVAKFMKVTEYQGVIANRWRNEDLAVKALESKL